MPFFSPGSSDYAPVLSSIQAQPAATRKKLAALSLDEPLPDTYAGDLIGLLVQSPYKLYLYWNHARDPFAALRKSFGAAAARYNLAVRLVDVESGHDNVYEATIARNYWFSAHPGRAYRAYVGFFAQGRPFIRLLSSAMARTPRVSVSRTADTTPEFRVTAPEFARVLNEAGYASDALDVALEAADEASHNEATRAIAQTMSGPDVPPVGADQLAEVRALIAALAFGESLERLRGTLSPTLARWIEQVSAAQGGAIDMNRLVEILRAAFGLELDYNAPFGLEVEDTMRRTPHFAWGASIVQLPSKPPHVWMPSMTPGVEGRVARWRRI